MAKLRFSEIFWLKLGSVLGRSCRPAVLCKLLRLAEEIGPPLYGQLGMDHGTSQQRNRDICCSRAWRSTHVVQLVLLRTQHYERAPHGANLPI